MYKILIKINSDDDKENDNDRTIHDNNNVIFYETQSVVRGKCWLLFISISDYYDEALGLKRQRKDIWQRLEILPQVRDSCL